MKIKKTIGITILAMALITVFYTIFPVIQTAVKAQIVLPEIPTSLRLAVKPITPLPNSSVTVSATVLGPNAFSVNYTWFLNNVRQATTFDKPTFSFRVGNLGTAYKVAVRVDITGVRSLNDSISLTVSDTDLTWGASDFAPSDYEGKILATLGSKISVSALPLIFVPGTNNLINPGDLTYTWSLNGVFDASRSGRGLSNFSLFAQNPQGELVELEIKNPQNTVLLKKTIGIPIIEPEILVFLAKTETDFISYKNALTSLTVGGGQNLTFRAMPYFFNADYKDLIWHWLIDEKEQKNSEPSSPWIANIKLPENISDLFTFNVKVSATNPKNQTEVSQSLINIKVIK